MKSMDSPAVATPEAEGAGGAEEAAAAEGDAASTAPNDEEVPAVAAVLPVIVPRAIGAPGQAWQPASSAGLACLYSPALDAVVLHGGLTPGAGRSAILNIGKLERKDDAEDGDPPAIRFSKLALNKELPPRCFHASMMLRGAAAGDQLVLFGGEGDPTRGASARPDKPDQPAMLNDMWSIDLASGRCTNLIPTAGAVPTPRTHHTIVSFREPPPPPPKLAAGRMKKHGLSLIMSQRASLGTLLPTPKKAVPGAAKSVPNLTGKPAAAGPAAAGPAAALQGLNFSAIGSKAKSPRRGNAAWTVLVIGGRTALPPDLAGLEDALHVLKLTESGQVQWIPSMAYLTQAIRRRQQQERVRAQSNAIILKAHADKEAAAAAASSDADEPPPEPKRRGIDAKRGMAVAAAKAAAAAEADLASACAVARETFALLQRHKHSTVVSGSVAVCFGGVQRGQATAHLVSVRVRDLAVSLLPYQGMAPLARHSHAATIGGGGMLVCGGQDGHRIFDDVHHLSIPKLEWSTLKVSATPLSEASRFLGRYSHQMASISHDEVIIFGGYAAEAIKFSKAATGGFAPNRAMIMFHSSPRAFQVSLKQQEPHKEVS